MMREERERVFEARCSKATEIVNRFLLPMFQPQPNRIVYIIISEILRSNKGGE